MNSFKRKEQEKELTKFRSTQRPIHYHEHHEVERNQVDPQYAQYSPLIKKDAA